MLPPKNSLLSMAPKTCPKSPKCTSGLPSVPRDFPNHQKSSGGEDRRRLLNERAQIENSMVAAPAPDSLLNWSKKSKNSIDSPLALPYFFRASLGRKVENR